MRNIILASASPRRKELLEKAGVVFQVKPGNGEEHITSQDPKQIVCQLSKEKAMAAAEDTCGNEWIIGADTIVVYQGKVLGKPADAADAVRTLEQLQDQTHQVYTGVTVLYREQGQWKNLTFSECTDVTFYPISREEICRYVETGDPLDKAGSYGIQGPFLVYVKEIRGDYCNVVGLPVARLFQETKKIGIDLRGRNDV